MDLHELKNTWTVLDEQLKKNEMLNKQIIQEMLQKKSNKSLNKLVNTDFINLIIWLLVIPASIWCYHLPKFEGFIFPKILFAVIIITSIPIIIWGGFQLRHLLNIDLSKSVKDNMSSVGRYTIMLKKEKIAVYFGLIPIYCILGILCYVETRASFLYWMFLIVACIFVVLTTYWAYKRFYDANVQVIKRSLEELDELK